MKRPTVPCPDCGRRQHADSATCESCGKITAGPPADCVNHPGVLARHACVVCGIPLCPECIDRAEGKSACRGKDHGTMVKAWEILRSVKSPFVGDLVVRNLVLNGIAARGIERDALDAGTTAPELSPTNIWTERGNRAAANALLRRLQIDGLKETEELTVKARHAARRRGATARMAGATGHPKRGRAAK